MDRANLTEDFNWDAVLQITERDYPVAEVAARLDQHILALRIEGTASTAIRRKGACISPAFGSVSQPDLVDYAAVRQAIVYHGNSPAGAIFDQGLRHRRKVLQANCAGSEVALERKFHVAVA